jgi:hypothetical protein
LLSAPHASQAAFIEGAAIAWSKKPSDVWNALSFLAIVLAERWNPSGAPNERSWNPFASLAVLQIDFKPMETDKSSYTDKQKRQAEHIEEGYENRGVSEKEAERRAWATVNKETHGGKKSGSGGYRGRPFAIPQRRPPGWCCGGQATCSGAIAVGQKAAKTRKRRAA